MNEQQTECPYQHRFNVLVKRLTVLQDCHQYQEAAVMAQLVEVENRKIVIWWTTRGFSFPMNHRRFIAVKCLGFRPEDRFQRWEGYYE